MKRLFIAALCGCLVMFIWGGLSHMVLFKGTGFKSLPNEDEVIKILNENVREQGLYLFPGIDFTNHTAEYQAAWENKFRNGAAGMVIYRPIGGDPFSINKLVTQFICTFISVFIAVIIVSRIAENYWRRVFIVSTLGILACSSVSSIYWNWYEFPTSFFIAQILDMVIGFFLAGLVISKIVPHPDLVHRQ
ncbi:MAG TPA: hypothetical protein VIT44_15515 [Cyclobacteriaceae bacterium]